MAAIRARAVSTNATPAGVLAELSKTYGAPKSIDTTNPVHLEWLRNMDRYERMMTLPARDRIIMLDAMAELMKGLHKVGAVTAFEIICSTIEKANF
jgi:hypothetical protein